VPTPVAHFLGALATHIAASPRDAIAWRARAAVTVAAGLAPDLDFAFKALGVAVHQGRSHSVGAAALAGLAVFAGGRLLGNRRAGGLGLAATLGWLSHVALDLMNVDTHPPIGLMALWPFSAEYYKLPVPLFLDVGRTLEWRTVWHNALAVAWETAVLCTLVVVIWRRRTREGPAARG
jgi:membrane-bound metal-dependent hydrolase YbcI (DUF457 family)